MKFAKFLAPLALLAALAATSAVAATVDNHKDTPKPAKHAEGDKKDAKGEKHADGDKKEAKADTKADAKPDDKAILVAQHWSYPLTTCPISGEKLDDKHVDFVVAGRMVRTCCDDCKAKVMKDPTEAFKKIDAAVIADQKAAYPLTTCPISNEKLGDKAVDKVWGTRLVRFCCADCAKEFDKDPKATMAKVDAAYIQAQKAAYPLKKCIVSGEELGGMGEPVEKLYGTTLVRFCCASCARSFEKDGDKYMKELAAARKPAK